jgi:hypothetical protein
MLDYESVKEVLINNGLRIEETRKSGRLRLRKIKGFIGNCLVCKYNSIDGYAILYLAMRIIDYTINYTNDYSFTVQKIEDLDKFIKEEIFKYKKIKSVLEVIKKEYELEKKKSTIEGDFE